MAAALQMDKIKKQQLKRFLYAKKKKLNETQHLFMSLQNEKNFKHWQINARAIAIQRFLYPKDKSTSKTQHYAWHQLHLYLMLPVLAFLFSVVSLFLGFKRGMPLSKSSSTFIKFIASPSLSSAREISSVRAAVSEVNWKNGRRRFFRWVMFGSVRDILAVGDRWGMSLQATAHVPDGPLLFDFLSMMWRNTTAPSELISSFVKGL